jgi:hypothetical protein
MTMRALLSLAPGGPDSLVIGEAPMPEPAGAEVRIRVRAVGINYPDLLIIEDKYQYKPQRPFAPGAEVSGVVDALGPDAHGFSLGDRVMAMAGWGGLAEYVCVPAAKCSPCPPDMPFDEAAAFLMTYGTSYHALKHRARLAAGETLLVLGAAGGVGLAAVELGRALGARVVAAASSEAKLEVARRRRRGRLRPGRRHLCRAGAARDRVGGSLSRGRLPRRHPRHPAQPAAAEKLRHMRRVLGRVDRARSGRPPQGGERAGRTLSGQPDQAADSCPVRLRAGGRRHRPAGDARRRRQGRRDHGLTTRAIPGKVGTGFPSGIA